MSNVSATELKKRARRLYRTMLKLYPDATCALVHRDPFELLVATILSAQCTDERVNKVTPALFEKYPSPTQMAQATQESLEELVHSTGFYRNKSKNILATAKRLAEHFDGQVPAEMEELLSLPGVARKTANVVLGNAFGKNQGVVVDTHVGRLSRRMGLTTQKDPKKIEQNLMNLFEQKNWTLLSHLFIFHGRQVCASRKPDCENCKLIKDCPQILPK